MSKYLNGKWVWVISYEGQTEPEHNWMCTYRVDADTMMRILQDEYPNRVWSMEEKDIG